MSIKRLRLFTLLKRNRKKFKLITAGTSRTTWCVFRTGKREKKTKSKFFVARSSCALPSEVKNSRGRGSPCVYMFKKQKNKLFFCVLK